MTQDVNANDLVAFIVELLALVLLGMWAWHAIVGPTWVRVAGVIATEAIAITLWALFASPDSVFESLPLEIATKVVVLGGSVLAAYSLADRGIWPTSWAVIVVINTALIYLGPFRR